MKRRPGESRNEPGGSQHGDSIQLAVNILTGGGLVAFPTETCYGLAVDPDNEKALSRLFQVKKRPEYKPVLLLVHDIVLLETLVRSIPEAYKPLIDQYWPGPLTLIFPARKGLSPYLTGGTETVGIRISPHPLAQTLGRLFGKALTATSANQSGQAPARHVSDILKSFPENIDYILDGGETPAGPCSTIIGLQKGELCLLRSGAVEIGGLTLA